MLGLVSLIFLQHPQALLPRNVVVLEPSGTANGAADTKVSHRHLLAELDTFNVSLFEKTVILYGFRIARSSLEKLVI